MALVLGLGLGLLERAIQPPSLSLDFLSTTTLDSRITFTRGSNATRVNSSGVIVTASNDVPRFDYDPVTLAAKGLLIEEARTNLLTYSEQFDNAAWTKNNTTTTANATTAPDGATTADKLAETATTAVHNAGQSITTTATAYNFSCYVKAAERNFAFLYHTQTNAAVSVNLSTGATGQPSGTVAPTSSSVTPVGNGWYRINMTVTATAASNFFGVYVADTLTSVSYAGTAGSGIYVWGAQLEAGAFATSYIPTVASTVTRSADVATMTGTNFSSWYNQTQGTFVVGADAFVDNSTIPYRPYGASDGTLSNIISGYIYTAKWGASGLVGGVFQFDLSRVGSYAANIPAKSALAYAANDFAFTVAGSTVATDTAGTLPTVDRLGIGNVAGFNFINGHIKTIAYFNTRLANAQLQSLTA